MNNQRKIYKTTITYNIINPIKDKVLDTQTETFNHLNMEEMLTIFDELDKNEYIEFQELKCEFETEDTPF